MKYLMGLILACCIMFASTDVQAHDRHPVRNLAKAVVCAPVKVVRQFKEKKPVRSAMKKFAHRFAFRNRGCGCK
mgnify:CR=1 FL=1